MKGYGVSDELEGGIWRLRDVGVMDMEAQRSWREGYGESRK